MYSGRKALSDIDNSLQSVRSQLAQTDYDLEQYNRKLLLLRQQESENYRELARLKLDDLRSNQLYQQLDYAEQQAAQLLMQRDEQIDTLINQIQTNETSQLALDAQRIEQAKQLDTALEALESLLEKVAEELQESENYCAQQLRAQDLVDMTSNARIKTEQAEKELKERGKPYRDDKLFMYLWDKNYGTRDYKAGFITRFFDKKIADYIRYDKARINYFTLNNIPKKLAEHTDNLQTEAEDQLALLKQLEREAEVQAGAEQYEKQVELERSELAKIDQSITEHEELFAKLIKQRESYNMGRDSYIAKAMNVLIDSFKADPIPQLKHEARETSTPKDDHIVNQLQIVKEQKEVLEDDLSNLQKRHHSINTRFNEILEIRRLFKRSDYDAYNSNFIDGERISRFLQQFLTNEISSRKLWKHLKKMQRFERRHYPRNGGIGLPGGVHFPSGGTRGPRIRFPRGIRFPSGWGGGGGGSSSGGGFKTGGGF